MTQNARVKDNVVRRMGKGINVSAEKWIPDSLLFAIILSILVYVAGIFIGNQSAISMLEHWYSGFWGFLAFTTQMAMVVITGHALANTDLIGSWLEALASFATTATKAVLLTFAAAFIAGYLNWGFGLVVGAIIAVNIAKKNNNVDYPLMVAAAYSGAMMATMGLSASAPLLVNTKGHFLEEQIGLLSLGETVFSMRAVLIQVAIFAASMVLFALMVPKNKEDLVKPSKAVTETKEVVKTNPEKSFASYLENATWISMIVGLAGIIVLAKYFMTNGPDFNIDIVNFMFLILGVILHKKPINYVKAVSDAVPSISGIMLQFPFYGGIMGMMQGSGLVGIFADWTQSFSTPGNFPVIAYLQSAVVNFFIPSAGGKFLIQGPVLLEAANALNVSDAITITAYSFGDVHTNIIQPFWALPLLGIANLKIKDIWGYCFMAAVVAIVITTIGFFI